METATHEPNAKEGKITALRTLLAEKFPHMARKADDTLPLAPGLPVLRRGAVTEVSGSIGSGTLFLESVLASAQASGTWAALVDSTRGFDPAQIGNSSLARLLWVLCQDAGSAIKAADLLLRDGNIPLVVLDLQMSPLHELRQIPATTWYRFQRLAEPSTSAFVVLTARPMVSSAAERITLCNRWTLSAMRQRRAELRLAVEYAQRRPRGEYAFPERRIA